MTNEELLVLLGTEPTDVTAEQLSWLTAEQLSGLTARQLSGLTARQLSGLTARQLSWLTAEQLSWLTAEQLSWLTAEQLSGLTALHERTPKIEKPYTKILEATDNCSANFDMRQWHCGTTHCAAGHIVVQAGEQGQVLEDEFDTPTAARLILRKSCPPDWPLPNFYASNEAAAAFIRAMAKREAETTAEQV